LVAATAWNKLERNQSSDKIDGRDGSFGSEALDSM
jgi:hypothetical protein